MKRVVLDTNVLVSALVWQGSPRQLLMRGMEDEIRFYTTPFLLQELYDTLHSKKLVRIQHQRFLDPGELHATISAILTPIEAPRLAHPVCRDPDDDWVLACAVSAGADMVVSGDQDLLVLKNHADIPIVNVMEAMQLLSFV